MAPPNHFSHIIIALWMAAADKIVCNECTTSMIDVLCFISLWKKMQVFFMSCSNLDREKSKSLWIGYYAVVTIIFFISQINQQSHNLILSSSLTTYLFSSVNRQCQGMKSDPFHNSLFMLVNTSKLHISSVAYPLQ